MQHVSTWTIFDDTGIIYVVLLIPMSYGLTVVAIRALTLFIGVSMSVNYAFRVTYVNTGPKRARVLYFLVQTY